MPHSKSYHFVLVSLFIKLCVKSFEKKDLCLKNYLKIAVQMLSPPLYYVSIKYIDFSLSQTIRFVSSSSIHHLNEGFSQRSAPRLHASFSTLGFYLFPWLQIASPCTQLPFFCFYPNLFFKKYYKQKSF